MDQLWPGTPGAPDNNPFCNATCLSWPQPGNSSANVSVTINMSNTSAVKFHDDARAALMDWSGQPYNSPWMYECNNCPNGTTVNIGWAAYDQSFCGKADIPTYSSNNQVLSAWANLNSNVQYEDGPTNDGSCDVQSAIYQEEGHDFTLGHSSDPTDVMFWRNCQCSSIGGNSQDGLNAIYGPYRSPNNGGGGCNGCQMACPQTTNVTNASTTTTDPSTTVNATLWTMCGEAWVTFPEVDGYYLKAWDMSQGVPAPNPVTIISPASCMQYYTSNQMVYWVDCTYSYYTYHSPMP